MAAARARGPRRFGLKPVVMLGVLLGLAACGEEPTTPPELIGFSPVIASVDADGTIALRIRYDGGGAEPRFQWTADAGAIEGDGPEVTYRAPGTPGDDRITVAAVGGANTPLETTVKVLSNDAGEDVPEPDAPVAVAARSTEEPSVAGIEEVRARGRLDAIVQIEFPPFSFYGEDGNRVGFDVDLAREMARRWLDDPRAVRFVPVPTDARIAGLQEGKGDVIVAALTNTPARREQIDFSATYFMDGQRLLVPNDSDIVDVCGLEGSKVAVIEGSTSLENLKEQATTCGFDIGADLVAFRRHADAVEALLGGDVAAYTSDGMALEAIAEDQPLKVVGNHFSEEPYGIGLPRGDTDFEDLVDATLAAIQADGTFAAIYHKWFGDTLEPYPMQTHATPEQVAALESEAPAAVAPANDADQPEAGSGETAYVVQPGDTLSKIAGKVWGDVSPGSWQRIYEANKAVIGDNPSLIEVGMTLTIPAA